MFASSIFSTQGCDPKKKKSKKNSKSFLINQFIKQAYLWVFYKNQRQLKFIFTRRLISPMPPLREKDIINDHHRLGLLTKGSLSVVLAIRLLESVNIHRQYKMHLSGCILSRLHVLPFLSYPTCISTIEAHKESICSVAFDKTQGLLATASHDKAVKLYNYSDPLNPKLVKDLRGHTEWVRSVVFQGPFLASGSHDENVILWDCSDPPKTFPIITLNFTKNIIFSLDFHPTQPFLALGSSENDVKLFNISQNPPTLIDLKGHTGWVKSIDFHQTLPLLASGSEDRLVILWDFSQNPPTLKKLPGHKDFVKSVKFHNKIPLLASGSSDNTIILWDCSDLQNIRQSKKLDITYEINALAFHPKLPLLASASTSTSIILWNCSDPENTYKVTNLSGHIHWVRSLAFDPTGNLLVSGSDDGKLKIWKL